MAGLRKKFCDGRGPKAPSSGANPVTFLKDQKMGTIYCNRPSDTPDTIPVTLLHPIFGQFMDDCEKHSPTAEDYTLAAELTVVMRRFYSLEKQRQAEILKVFHNANIIINGSRIGDYTTDGDLSVGLLRYLIAEMKNEIGSQGAEPYLQGILYHLESTRDQALQYLHSVLPCMIISLFGTLALFYFLKYLR